MLVFRRQSKSTGHKCEGLQIYSTVCQLMYTFVLATGETTVTQQVSHRPISNVNPACGHKEVPRSTGHIMVTTRYSDQQGSKSLQKVMRLYKQWHRPIPKRFIKPFLTPYRESSLDRLGLFKKNLNASKPSEHPPQVVVVAPAFSATKRTNYAPTSFDQQVQVSQGQTSYKNKEN